MRLGTPVIVPVLLMASAQSGAQIEPAPVTVVGRVVDAACYMMHPEAATVASHEDCGRACAQRGVPLAIIDDKTKQLYIADAKSSKALLTHLHQPVRVTGHSTKRSDPLQLEMPVGATHTMSVRVDGGYNALTVERVERVGQGRQDQPR